MTMLKMADDCYVAADQIIEVRINTSVIIVRTKDGMAHSYKRDYGRSIYAALDDLIEKINVATQGKTELAS